MRTLKLCFALAFLLLGLAVLAVLEYSLFLPGGSGASVLKYFKEGPLMFHNMSQEVAFTVVFGLLYAVLAAIIIVPAVLWLSYILNEGKESK